MTHASDTTTRGWSLGPVIHPGRIVAWTLLALGAVVMMVPLVYMVATSFKYPNEVYELNIIPHEPTLDNYTYIFQNTRFGIWFVNSLLTSSLVTVSVLFFDSLVGYTLAKFKFRGREFVFIAILTTLMIPTEMLIVPWYIMAKNFGWLNSYWGIMFPGLITGFGVFLMRQFFSGIPDDYIHAARIDGLNEFQIWWKVAMPLVTPALSALAIFTFLGNWTAFLWPLIATNDRALYTVPVGLASFSGEFLSDWELIMTGATLATLPTLIVFIIFQRYIIRGVVLAGLKG
ncbi:carbohydrate ABC transporter permease [Chelatococcus asaccharovorans]|uniref:Carbohydrate ABC transporter membrane protein 2 (CUT1 family) n=1 Tax=Chelatococcus asaccharovorans TaxID=28210 RepID=A0A2V3UC56_9HYPH|nr:carbohydrate ABC transporter permease [Chelatococcus asaccharovorans]MBS7705218.1 carbohydrate ABC transporter permease [Chelatococcus asaccharovorans]PXW60378.1 carbohydrate ABC transporter membrane protein 2 (CUT1 family) [Chelatococcus asaccharovorans]